MIITDKLIDTIENLVLRTILMKSELHTDKKGKTNIYKDMPLAISIVRELALHHNVSK